jgi:hypothetical protein
MNRLEGNAKAAKPAKRNICVALFARFAFDVVTR